MLKPVLLTFLLVCCTAASAQLRVIIQYDAEGHSLLRAVELGEQGSGNAERTGGVLGHSVAEVVLKWFSEEGELLHTGQIADPRLVHAPLTVNGQAPQLVGLDNGAYMVMGPTGSAVLEVFLPANPSLGLYSHTFRINLPLPAVQ